MTEPGPTIRDAVIGDVPVITNIYNEAILTTTATFHIEPRTFDEQTEWFQAHDDRHPVIVAECDGEVVGWACLNEWSDRPAYADTCESSFYVRHSHRGRGIGRLLKAEIVDRARQLGFHTLIARVAAGSDVSLHLNRQFGFEYVGTLKEVGRKFGRLLDVHILQLMLKPGAGEHQ